LFLPRNGLTNVAWQKLTFRSIVAGSRRIVGPYRAWRLRWRLAIVSQRGLFIGALRLFSGPFGASTFTPLLILSRWRNRGRNDRWPVKCDVGILRFEPPPRFLVEGWSPYLDAWRRPIPVQNPLAGRPATPILNVNEVGAFVAAFVSGKSEKGHDLLAFG
jgi:hypothetical protein